MKKITTILLFIVLAAIFSGCGNDSATKSEAKPDKKTVIVATQPTLKDIVNAAKPEFDKSGITMEVKVFDDLVSPDTALQEGSVELNFFQHEPYMNQFNKNKGGTLEKYHQGIMKYYMGIFSKKYKSLSEIADGITVTIPNDPSNRARALKTMQTNGLIKLKDGVELPTKLDIIENNKNLNIVETDVPKLPSTLDDVEVSVINSIVAVNANIDPRSALGIEDQAESDKYALIISIKKGANNEKYAEILEKALKSDAEKKFLEERYKGAIATLF